LGEKEIILPEKFPVGFFDSGVRYKNISKSEKVTITTFEIFLFAQDGGTFYLDDIPFVAKKDEILLIKPGQIRYREQHYKCFYIHFDVRGYLYDLCMKLPNSFRTINTQKITSLFKSLTMLREEGSENSRLLAASQFLELLYLVIEDARAAGSKTFCKTVDLFSVRRAKSFVDNNFAKKITVDDMAKAANFSPSYFRTLFFTACGMTPHDYIVKRRVQAAKELLWDDSVPLSHIPERCGFGCQSYFSSVFKKETVMTPFQYKHNCGKKLSSP